MNSREGILDATLVPLGLMFLVSYQLFWLWRVRYSPLRTVIGVNHLARRHWVDSIMKENEKKNILAVQTLRNNIMGSTLMATTAILLCSATAVFMSSAYFSTKQPLLGGDNPKLLGFKYLTLIACFIFSFFSYAQSIRYTNHVNFLVNIPLQEAMAIRISPEYVANVLARGCNFFTAGTRGFYFALPLLLWLFSPIAVLCSCIVLVPVLYYLDASGLDSDDEFLRKNNSLTTTSQRISMAPPRPLMNGASGPHVFRASSHDLLRKPAAADGDMLLMSACSDHWSNSDMRIRATQELVR